MQTYLNVRAMNVGNDPAQGSRGTDLSRAIPAGRETSATVLQVSQSQSQPGQFIIQLQVGNRTLELATPRPFPQGSQVLLSRDAQGNIQLQLPVNNNSAAADNSRIQNAPAQARADAEALLMRITANSSQQAANLPLNQPQRGVVLAQPSANGQAAANASTSNTSSGQTLNTQAPASTSSSTQSPTASSTAQTPGNPTPTTAANSGTLAAQSNTASATGNPPTVGQLTPSQTTTAQASGQPAAATNSAMPGQQSNSASQTAINTNLVNTPAPATATQNASSPTTVTTANTTNTAANATATATPTNATNLGVNVATTANQAANLANINITNVSTGNANTASNSAASQTVSTAPSTTASTTTASTNPAANTSSPSPIANLINSNEAANRPQGFPVRVLVAGQVIDLVSPRPVQSGQQVDVTRNEQGLIRIQFSQPTTPLAQQPAVQAIMQQALREVLPVQLPLADGLNQLMQISERQGTRQNNALNQLIQSMLSLFSVKPGSADADKAIARNLQQGGLLSEAGLSRTGQQPPPADLKQQLGQLLKVADQLPAQAREQLNQLVNALLARSTAQQISSLQRWRDLPDGGQERHYRLDLPIQQQQGFENAELRITEHRRRNEEGEFVTLWTVRLHFELEEEGAMDAELSLQDRFQLNANFWVEKPETLERLRERLNSFEQELKTKGFEVAPLNARLGKLENPQVTPLSKRLVDIHT